MIANTCLHCDNISNYKCPTCRQPYCSVTCYKIHKDIPCNPPPAPETQVQPPQTHYEFPTEDTVKPEKLDLLAHSSEIKNCLSNPHLRNILEELNNSPHPDLLIQEYMQEPIFTEFVDECLKVVQPAEDRL